MNANSEDHSKGRCIFCLQSQDSLLAGYCRPISYNDNIGSNDSYLNSPCYQAQEVLRILQLSLDAYAKSKKKSKTLTTYSRDTSYGNFVKTIKRMVSKGRMKPLDESISILNNNRNFIDAENHFHESGLIGEYRQMMRDFRSHRMHCRDIANNDAYVSFKIVELHHERAISLGHHSLESGYVGNKESKYILERYYAARDNLLKP